MEQTWRWFGPDDVIRLADIRQAGATGIVTALHQIPYGVVWSVDEIEERKALIGAEPSLGLSWSVVESLPVHEAIKIGEGDLDPLFDNYRQSLRNLAACGIGTVCYNFMPVLDWTRTELRHPLPGGGRALRFDAPVFAAFDCSCWSAGRRGRSPPKVVDRAPDLVRPRVRERQANTPRQYHGRPARRLRPLRHSGPEAHAGPLPRHARDALRENLARFLRQVIPTAEEIGVRMAIHPDDPPRPLMGLPRIVSSEDDLAFIVEPYVAGERNHAVHGLPRGGAAQRRPGDRAGASRARPFRASAQRRQGARRLVHGGRAPRRRHRHGRAGRRRCLASRSAARMPATRTGASRCGRTTATSCSTTSARHYPGYPLIGRLKGLAELRGVMRALAAISRPPVIGSGRRAPSRRARGRVTPRSASP